MIKCWFCSQRYPLRLLRSKVSVTVITVIPFDPAYTQLFSYPKMVRDLLVNFVKQPWVNDIDWDSLHTLSPKFVTKKLRKRESDIIWTAKWHDRDLYIILFLEFQSSVD
ncbi:Rpn family recombination-promoting nuclease/putative transposase, partial [Pseudobacteriovorax antillogorgiicola]|uniref:Rpn family recombination-promoting nuclease/putative transposase n=1 Tax=Pseudobacteriovorax antillogorgiicola TaxID=1513793 RepID=UPI001179FC5A